jgi:hypothetical protein
MAVLSTNIINISPNLYAVFIIMIELNSLLSFFKNEFFVRPMKYRKIIF